MMNYWISYYVPTNRLSDFELHSPWWISGFTCDEDRERTTIVAAIQAESEEAAIERFMASFDSNPEAELRFIEAFDGSPYSSRFQQADWMVWDESA